jgi:membrane-bound metal-dependent hydrolase YbcI (DUF457 family)
LGGTAICVLIGAILVADTRRRQTLLVLSLGAASHLLADLFLTKASGRAFPILWPFTCWRPPTPGLYLSTHPEPTIVTGVVAALIWGVSRWRRSQHLTDR